jgi:hypothetical protein
MALARVSKQTARQSTFSRQKSTLEAVGGTRMLDEDDLDDEMGSAELEDIGNDAFFEDAEEDEPRSKRSKTADLTVPDFAVEERPEMMDWEEEDGEDGEGRERGPEDWRRHYMKERDQEFWFKKRYASHEGQDRAPKRSRDDQVPAWKDPSKSRSERRKLRGQVWEGRAVSSVANALSASTGLGFKDKPPFRSKARDDSRTGPPSDSRRGPPSDSRTGPPSEAPRTEHSSRPRAPKLSSKRVHLTFD